MRKYIVGITGASGSVFGVRLITCLLAKGHQVFITITEAGKRVIAEEIGWHLPEKAEEIEEKLSDILGTKKEDSKLRYFDIKNVGALIASGSVKTDGMIIIPCTMSTVAAVARGASTDLLERAADVTIKEKRPLIIVPRETPLSQIHLQNLLLLAQLGVQIIPPMPAFYNHPQTVDDIVDFLVGRVLDSLGIEHDLVKRWQG